MGILSAVLPLGCVAATPFISYVGDRFGRRAGICLGGVIMVIGGVIQGVSVHSKDPRSAKTMTRWLIQAVAMFLVARFIIGCGVVFANSFAPIIIGELAHPRQRSVLTSLYQTSFYLGAIGAAWTTFGTFTIPNEWSWRIPSLLQSGPALVMTMGVWFLPESPRVRTTSP